MHADTPEQTRTLGGRFQLQRVLGRGGMATVWAATDLRLGRTVAVKVLRDDLPAEHAHRIEREARAAARILDPRVVTVLDLEHDEDGTPFLVMEALEGATLCDELRNGALPPERADRLAADLLGGLAAAHEAGVLHRDIKPSNLLLTDDGYRITDFGIASMDDDATTAGDLMGTLVYLAPERFDGAPATPQSDVFSAAAVLYEAVSGRQPFRGETATDSLRNLRTGRFDPLPDEVPAALASAIATALDPDPASRPADAGAMARMVAGDPVPVTEPVEAVDVTQRIELDAVPQADPDAERTVRIERPPAPAPAPTGVPTTSEPVATDDADSPDPWERVRVVGDRIVQTARTRPQVVFVIVGVLLLLGVFVAAAGDGQPGTGAEPAGPRVALDQQLDRIEEIGR